MNNNTIDFDKVELAFKRVSQCDLCGSDNCQTIIFKLNSKQNLVKCGGCQLVYLDNQCQDLDKIYNDEYFFGGIDSTCNYANYKFYKSAVQKNFKFAKKFIIKNNYRKILEIGGGYGYFIEQFKNDYEVEAVEISQVAADKIRQLGIKTRQGNFLKIDFSQKFDVVLCFDVIEHQVEIRKFIEKIYSLLNFGGVLIFTVPNFGSFLQKIFGANGPMIQPLYHNYYFNDFSLARLASRFGFQTIRQKREFINYMTLGHIYLMFSMIFPKIKKFSILNNLFLKTKFGSKVIPFIRVGGLSCVFKK